MIQPSSPSQLTESHIELLRLALPLMTSSERISFVTDVLMGVEVTWARYRALGGHGSNSVDYWAARSIHCLLLGGHSEYNTLHELSGAIGTVVSSTPLTTK